MFSTSASLRPARLTRVVLAIVVLFALVGGAGVALADSDDNDARNCPTDNPTNAYNSTSDTAFTKSADGRQEALEGGECTTKKETA